MNNFLSWPPSWATILLVPALLVGFTVHELAHAVVAFLLGDTSQVERKRLSFNPIRHVSWLGMVAFLIFGFGWAKPVWVDYARLRIRNRPFGMFLVSIAGASANLLLSLLALFGLTVSVLIVSSLTGSSPWDILMKLMTQPPGPDPMGLAVALSTYMVTANLMLGFFNLLPFPPLDGFQAAMSLYTIIRNALRGRKDDVALAGQARGLLPRPHPAATAPSADEAEEPLLSPAQIHLNIGLDYHQEGQLDEAIARYRQAIAQDEHSALAYYNLGLAYWGKGRIPLAQGAFRAATQSHDDMSVRVQAGLRLQELTVAQQDGEHEVGPPPPPMAPGDAPKVTAAEPPPLDPTVLRNIWMRLGVGGALMLLVALGMWLYVTAVLYSAWI